MIFSDKQTAFLKERLHEYNILQGVTASGKSFIANIKWYTHIVGVPNNSILIQSGNTADTLYDNVTSKLLEIDQGIGWLEYKTVEGRKRIVVKPTGSQVVCVGADDERAQDRVRGKSVWGWYGDEITKQPKSFVEQCSALCRAEYGGKLRTTPILWTLNPDSPLHYIKKQYIDRSEELDANNWVFGFRDNPLVDDVFIAKLKTRFTGMFAKRMIDGLWVLAEGVVYDNFIPSEHIIKTYPEKQIVEWTIGYDWGFIHPLVLLLIGTDSEGIDYVVDELYCKNQLIDEGLKAKVASRGWLERNISTIYGSPERPEFIYQIQELFGISTVPADNEVLEGIHEVQKKLNKRADGKCGLYFLEHCPNIINEMQAYSWKPSTGLVFKDEPIKVNDDGVDALRYNIYSRRNAFGNMFADVKMSMTLQPDERTMFEKSMREL